MPEALADLQYSSRARHPVRSYVSITDPCARVAALPVSPLLLRIRAMIVFTCLSTSSCGSLSSSSRTSGLNLPSPRCQASFRAQSMHVASKQTFSSDCMFFSSLMRSSGSMMPQAASTDAYVAISGSSEASASLPATSAAWRSNPSSRSCMARYWSVSSLSLWGSSRPSRSLRV